LKKGEKHRKLKLLRILDTRREPLSTMRDYGQEECAREGFPHLTPDEFIEMLVAHSGKTEDDDVNRIEFEYVNHA
jgi:hypothetical protein